MSETVTVELDEARTVMYNSLLEDDNIPDEVIESQFEEVLKKQLQQLYDNREQIAQQIAQQQQQR